MATVILAGFNADAESLSALDPLPTPETLSAAYARISRDPRPIPDLRAEARAEVERARASNRRIVFGFGHHSVAEHAVLNLDLLDVSRLAVEAIESHRLASFTEKSQRYVRLGEGFVTPPELASDESVPDFLARCFRRYETLAEALMASGVDPRLAGEDARYVLPLATATQLGMTVNARELEHMIRCLSGHPLAEVRNLGTRLLEVGNAVVPSLMRHVGGADRWYSGGVHEGLDLGSAAACRRFESAGDEGVAKGRSVARRSESEPDAGSGGASKPESYPCHTAQGFGGPRDAAAGRRRPSQQDRSFATPSDPAHSPVHLAVATPDGDMLVLAALAAPEAGLSLAGARDRVRRLDEAGRRRLLALALQGLTAHDPAPRAFEHATLTFELVLSSAAFGQLKRHRMASLTPSPYEPELSVTVPPSVAHAGLQPLFDEAAADASERYRAAGGGDAPHAAYLLLNAHRRRVILTLNLREMVHFSRLREDAHAQWDIRELATRMAALAREAFPVCGSFLGGKDVFSIPGSVECGGLPPL